MPTDSRDRMVYPMDVDVREESSARLDDYASVPIDFDVAEVLDVEARENGLGGLGLRARALGRPYVKNYDALDGGPTRWAQRFDLSNWGFFAAYVGGERVGGAAVVQEREDLAVLWDLRVARDRRACGVGVALLAAAESWSAARACRQLKVETQNVNVPACRFYSRHGFVLGGIHRFAYPALPDEVQLLWYKTLAR